MAGKARCNLSSGRAVTTSLPFADFRQAQKRLRTGQLRHILRQDWTGVPGAAASLRLLRHSFEAGTPPARLCLLHSPLLGGWIQDVLFWRETWRIALRLAAGHGSVPDRLRLFEKVATTEFLAEVVPAGRLDSRFPRRALACAQTVLAARMADLPRVIWPHLACRSVMRLRLALAENTDEGCPSGWLRLGMTPLCVVRKEARAAAWLAATLSRSSLSLGNDARVEIQETIPGTSILLTHRLLSRGHSLRVGARVPRLGRRLARALAIVDSAWGEAGEEIRTRTWMVVPLVEPGTVSYSHLARPGISYLNVFRGGLLDLADDLLHEAAHHRLHARQEISPLAKDDGEPRYYSPWRRAWRPLNGILHGTYTFLFRAELFLRMEPSRELSSGRRRWLAHEQAREIENCGRCLADLAGARSERLLTPAGESLLHGMGLWHARLRRGRLSGNSHFCIF